MATTLKKASRSGNLSIEEQSLLGWADAILNLQEKREAAKSRLAAMATSEESGTRTYKRQDSGGMTAAVSVLERERFRVDLLSAQRGGSDAYFYRAQAVRDVTAAHYGDDDRAREAALQLLLEQTEALRMEISQARSQAVAWCNNSSNTGLNRHLGRDHMEHAYLYLNEKIRVGEDLSNDAVASEIREFFQTELAQHEGFDGVDLTPLAPLLVSWLMLENESQTIEKSVHTVLAGGTLDGMVGLGGRGRGGTSAEDYSGAADNEANGTAEGDLLDLASLYVWDQYWDNESGHFYYVHRESGESTWDVPPEGFVPNSEHGFEGEWWGEGRRAGIERPRQPPLSRTAFRERGVDVGGEVPQLEHPCEGRGDAGGIGSALA